MLVACLCLAMARLYSLVLMTGAFHAWSVDTGSLMREFEGHTGSVTSLVLSGDGKTLFSGSFDNSVCAWSVDTGSELHRVGSEFCIWSSGPWHLSADACLLDGSTTLSQANRKLLCQHGALDALQYRAGSMIEQVKAGRIAIVQWLSRQGDASSTEIDNEGRTALLVAASGGQLELVKWLLQEGGASIEDINQKGRTAADLAHNEVREYLVSLGCKLNAGKI